MWLCNTIPLGTTQNTCTQKVELIHQTNKTCLKYKIQSALANHVLSMLIMSWGSKSRCPLHRMVREPPKSILFCNTSLIQIKTAATFHAYCKNNKITWNKCYVTKTKKDRCCCPSLWCWKIAGLDKPT